MTESSLESNELENSTSVDNIVSQMAKTFADQSNGRWGHEEWLGFLESVRGVGINSLSDDEVGIILEQAKTNYYRHLFDSYQLIDRIGDKFASNDLSSIVKILGKNDLTTDEFWDCTYYNWYPLGICMCFSKTGILKTVFFYNLDNEKWDQFQGELPYGIRFSDNSSLIEKKVEQLQIIDNSDEIRIILKTEFGPFSHYDKINMVVEYWPNQSIKYLYFNGGYEPLERAQAIGRARKIIRLKRKDLYLANCMRCDKCGYVIKDIEGASLHYINKSYMKEEIWCFSCTKNYYPIKKFFV